MPRRALVFGLFLVASLTTGFATPATSASGDSVSGKGIAVPIDKGFGGSVTMIDAHGTGSGIDATGTWRWIFGGGASGSGVAGDVTCLYVAGDQAIVGGVVTSGVDPDFPYFILGFDTGADPETYSVNYTTVSPNTLPFGNCYVANQFPIITGHFTMSTIVIVDG